ncbi:hypothetical protein [Flavobacterium ovatum]|jgi:putative lipase involved disintegration of autophagic bodies|uniref:hypothetical protein n=1 Tax=Flavobacterium ovatum TaxID=1928857 RepID=UPI0034510D0B
MKKYFYTIIITFLISTCFTGCSVYSTATTNKWLEYELPPSKIIENGTVFYEGKLSDGSLFSVFYDNDINNDGDYYNAILRQDFGWQRIDSKSWKGSDFARNNKAGHIYINPYRQVAIYYYPDGKYHNAFKVSIN